MISQINIGVCGNIDLSELSTSIDNLIPGNTVIQGEKNLFREELRFPAGDFVRLDICIIALDWRDLVPEIYHIGFGDDLSYGKELFQKACDEIRTIITEFRKYSSARILIFSPVSEWQTYLGFIGRFVKESTNSLFWDCQSIFDSLCSFFSEVFPVDMEFISNYVGKNHIYNDVGRFTAGKPFTTEMIQAIARYIRDVVNQLTKYPLKCVVFDLDNTMWGGIIGEDGFANITLGNDGLGLAYKEFQSEFVKLSKQGIMLAICSKNNTCDALEVIEKHPHMLIRPEMISCYRINWDDKNKNISEIASELNIGFHSIMFVDDNPAERELIRLTLPDVEILDLPQEPERYADTIRKCTRFWPLSITESDIRKREFISSNRKRCYAFCQSDDKEKFLSQSEIKIVIGKASQTTFPRITQLFNKTNQFNLTTKRYSQPQLELMMTKNENSLFWMSLSDKYGDYGIVATALILYDTIDSFILSCRAFGKEVESAFLNFILNHLSLQGMEYVYGKYISSEKNSMVKEFYKKEGFVFHSLSDKENLWKCVLKDNKRDVPYWLTLEDIT